MRYGTSIVLHQSFLRKRHTRSGISAGKGKDSSASQTHHTSPELCAAVMAVDLADTICEQIDFDRDSFHFTWRAALFFRYISNDCRRFNVYVANWVGRIRSFSKPCQWNYVPTVYNPADLATTDFNARYILYSMLIRRPSLLRKDPVMNKNVQSKSDQSPLVCAKETGKWRRRPSPSWTDRWMGMLFKFFFTHW